MKQLPRWKKSSFSGPNGGNCVETRVLTARQVAVRDSKDTTRGHLHIPGDAWNAFTNTVGGLAR